MSIITDIPEREGEDGATQLSYLRSYLKDTDSLNYVYSDTLLIDLLVVDARESVWETITGYIGETPWGYNPIAPISNESRIRILTGDTDELNLRYTDYELKTFLETIPLRYIVKLIKAEEENDFTYPVEDIDHPLYIIRKYLGDTNINSPINQDAAYIKMLFLSGLDPFAFVAELLTRAAGTVISSAATKGGNNLASLDGISFSSGETRTENLEEDIKYIASQAVNSPYYRDPVYGSWQDRIDAVNTGWEIEWYGV